MYISDLEVENLSDMQMTELLFSGMEDDQETGDCIFVVGSSKAVEYRLPKAIDLYKQGRAGKILFSGGVTWNPSEVPEAVALKERAMALGVPEEDILIEDKSLHTQENVLASLLVLNREFQLWRITRILAVTNAYHMRRLHLTLKTYMPDWIDYTLCPQQDTNTGKDNWYTNERSRQRVYTEAEKLIKYVKQGALADMPVTF